MAARRRRRRHRRRGAGHAPVPAPTADQGLRDAHRLLWRAGFGPAPGQAEQMAALSRQAMVYSLTRPSGEANLVGPAPRLAGGQPLSPNDAFGHDHLWWLDRMVRSDQPLVERMTLVYHDWFATSNDKVGSQPLMLAQNALLRSHALGSFAELFDAVTTDPAMLIWLDGNRNRARSVNENYAREMMELFSLGADRGAYTETDVRENARALSGWTNDRVNNADANFHYDASLHDAGTKTFLGQTGRFDWEDSVRLCLGHPLHPSFYVAKLWSYFNPVAPDTATVERLASLYVQTGYSARAVLEQVLTHPSFWSGPAMLKPPVVHTAGMLRALRSGIRSEQWISLARQTTQQLFYPPNVSGFNKTQPLDTSTFLGRWEGAALALAPFLLDGRAHARPRVRQSPGQAVAVALRAVGSPLLSAGTLGYLERFATRSLPGARRPRVDARLAAMRHNALRQLILTCPDYHAC